VVYKIIKQIYKRLKKLPIIKKATLGSLALYNGIHGFIYLKVQFKHKLTREEHNRLYNYFLSSKKSSVKGTYKFKRDIIAFSKGAPLTIDIMGAKLPDIISKLTQNPIEISTLYGKDIHSHSKAELKTYCDARIQPRIEKRHQEFKSRKSSFSLKLAHEAYADIKYFLDTNKMPFFLISGTLLGAIREGDFLKNDYDIDLGFYAWDIEMQQLREAILDSEKFSMNEYATNDLLRIKHKNGIVIDLYKHFIENNALCHQVPYQKWYNTPFTLTTINFAGSTAYIPDNYDLYLSENYGNWRDDICFFDFSFDTPNTKYPNSLDTLEYFTNRMVSGIKNSWRRQFVCVNKALKQAFDLDFMDFYPSMADGDIMDNYGERLQLLIVDHDELQNPEIVLERVIDYIEGTNIRLDIAIKDGSKEDQELFKLFEFIHTVISFKSFGALKSEKLYNYDKIITNIDNEKLVDYPMKKIDFKGK